MVILLAIILVMLTVMSTYLHVCVIYVNYIAAMWVSVCNLHVMSVDIHGCNY